MAIRTYCLLISRSVISMITVYVMAVKLAFINGDKTTAFTGNFEKPFFLSLFLYLHF